MGSRRLILRTHTQAMMFNNLELSETSTLNPNAPVFIPSYAHALLDESEARLADEAMAMLHHLACVNDSDTLNEASLWLGTDPDGWFENGMSYMRPDVLDEETSYYCDREDVIRDSLYRAPQQRKGDTRGRARPRCH